MTHDYLHTEKYLRCAVRAYPFGTVINKGLGGRDEFKARRDGQLHNFVQAAPR
jgi:hypothetical protein